MSLIFSANKIADFDSKMETSGTITDGTLAGWTKPFIKFTGDGVDAGTNELYCAKDFGSDYSALVFRLIIEVGTDVTARLANVIRMLDSSNNDVGSLYFNTSWVLGAFIRHNVTPYYTIPQSGGWKPNNFIELWFTWGAATGAATEDGYSGVGGQTQGRMGSKVDYENYGKSVRKIRVGSNNNADAITGNFYIHQLDVWDSRPIEAERIHWAGANGHYFEGCPTFFDLSGNTGQSVTSVEIKRGAGSYDDITLSATTGTRSDALILDAELTATVFDVASGTYDGCFVEPTAAPSALLPASQIVKQKQGSGTGTAYLVGYPCWLSIEEAAYTSNANTCMLQTFDLWQTKEITSGVYRVGIPGSKIGPGKHTVKVTLGDASEITQEFYAYARGRGARSYRHEGGRNLVIGYDDGSVDHPSQYRINYSTRQYRPYFAVIMGRAGNTTCSSPDIWKNYIEPTGCDIACHLWNNDRVNDYADNAEALEFIDMAITVGLCHGFRPWLFVTPGGVIKMPDDTSGLPYFYERFVLERTVPGSVLGNSVPLSDELDMKSSSLNNSLPGADDAAKAAALIAEMDDAAPVLYGVQWHKIGDEANQSTQELIAAVMSAADGSDLRVITLKDYLANG